jgi:competence protein ComEC
MGTSILWAVVFGFLAGVFLRSLVPLGLAFVGFLLVLAAATLLVSFSARQAARGAVVTLALLALGVGMLRVEAAVPVPETLLEGKLESEVAIEGFVSGEPDVREGSVRVPVRLESGTGVLVIVPAHTNVRYGDRVRAEGTLRFPEAFEIGVGREFNYPAYLAKDGIRYELAFAQVETTGRGGTNSLKSFAIWAKQTFLTGLGRALPEPHAGLAGGITAGDKRGLGSELSEMFRTVSLTHIIVLSGYNIMIVVLGLGWLLGKLHAPRIWKLFFGIGIAVLFALITGLASASVRAAAMASIALIGQYTERLYLAARTLAVVSALMVLWNPLVLVFDPGFQLSVLATAGLIALTPYLARRLTFVTRALNLREIFATTLSAQIAVLPLLLYQSGQFPLYALPANLLVLIAVPWAMLFSAVASLGGLFLGPFAVVLAAPAYALLSYIIKAGEFFSSLPYASVTFPPFSAWWLVLIYGWLVLWAYHEHRRSRRRDKGAASQREIETGTDGSRTTNSTAAAGGAD